MSGLPAISHASCPSASFTVVAMQGSNSSLPLSTVMALYEITACITYEVMQETLHEVCMHLPISCPGPHLPQAMLLSRSRLGACCSSQLRIITSALFLLIALLLFLLRSGALSLGAFWPALFPVLQVPVSQTHPPTELHHDLVCITIHSWEDFFIPQMCLWMGGGSGPRRARLGVHQREQHKMPITADHWNRSTAAYLSSRAHSTSHKFLNYRWSTFFTALSLQSINGEHKILSVGDNTLALFRHESNIQVTSIRVR
jgi:hypothetical protein